MLRAVSDLRPASITLTTPRPSHDPDRPYVPPKAPAPTARAAQKRRERAKQNGLEAVVPTPATAPETIAENEVALTDDLAATVVRKTLKSLASGDLEPSLRDGLIAQQLLDRRAEKVADRQFMLALAQALAGGGYEAPARLVSGAVEPPEEPIEGYFEDITLAPDHMRSE
jgi:hypothetical protein